MNCCFCSILIPSGPLVTPFNYEDDEYPKRYAPVCQQCMEECKNGKRTKEEFLEVAKPK